MKRYLLLIFFILSTFFVFTAPVYASTQTLTPDQEVKMMNLSIPWVENQGQISNPAVKFSAQTLMGAVFITQDGAITYSLASAIPTGDKNVSAEESLNSALSDPSALLGMTKKKEQKIQSVVIKEVPLFKNNPQIKGVDPSPTKTNYFIGNDKSKWKSSVSTYNLVSEGFIYPKIKLQLKAHNNNVEKIYTVSPYGDPRDIKMKVEGASKLEITANGDLAVTPQCNSSLPLIKGVPDASRGRDLQNPPQPSFLKGGSDCGVEPIYFTDPIAYQNIKGQRIPVTVKYKLLASPPYLGGAGGGKGGEEGLTYTFELGKYDTKYPLIIDPSFNYLLASTYLGGNNDEFPFLYAIIVNSLGNVYFAGQTASTNFPITSGAASTTYGGSSYDVFVAKLDSSLTSIVASTYLGGNAKDSNPAMALDSSDNVYVAIVTASTNFSVTAGAVSSTYGGGIHDVGLVKLNSSLTNILASTYLGGNDADYSYRLLLDSLDNIWVAGVTASQNFATTTGAYQTDYGSGSTYNGYITKLNNNLTSIVASTYFGGNNSGFNNLNGMSFDSSGNIYVVGNVISANFPTTDGAYQTSYGGGSWEAYVSKFNGNLTSLLASTYLGGSGSDLLYTMTLDSSDNVYVAGKSASTNFPTTALAYQTSYGGGTYNVIISKFNSALTMLSASTYLGTDGNQIPNVIILDSSNNVYVAGYTTSSNFPTTLNAYQTAFGGGTSDAYVSKLNNNLTALLASTYLGGGDGVEMADSATFDSSGNLYVVGHTASTNFPVITGAYQTAYAGGTGYDNFIAKFGTYLPGITSVSPSEVIQNADATTLTVSGTNFASGASVKFDGTALVTTFSSSTILTATLPASLVSVAGDHTVTVYNPLDDGGTSGNIGFKTNFAGVSHPPVATPIITPTETPITPSPDDMSAEVSTKAEALAKEGAITVTVIPATDPNATGTYSPTSAKEATPSLQVNLNIVQSVSTSTICAPETLIKSQFNSSVYYCGGDGMRYVFANESVYFTWFKDFADIKILTDPELAQIPLGHKLITHRPGIKMVKIQTDPKVYAVARGGILRWIKDEATAKLFYGDAWNTEILDVSDALFTSYTIGGAISGM